MKIAVSLVWLFVFALFPYNEANAQCAYSVACTAPLVPDYAPGCASVITTPVFGVADNVTYVPHLYSNYLSRTVIQDYAYPATYGVAYRRPLTYSYAYYRPRVYYRSYYRPYFRPRVYYRSYYRPYFRPRVYYRSYYRPHYHLSRTMIRDYHPFGVVRRAYIRHW
jgi:hypothetical protein